ncbi:hypothetical protein [Novilysobacter arseniciresistens]|uniref:hypothetical protein n=1 Tax=Novilysobacter arseniciresistens TaxID=1385522 RepID=UPI0012698AC1|nr:hypothetical protein [Lysobacter arseniciresistens]
MQDDFEDEDEFSCVAVSFDELSSWVEEGLEECANAHGKDTDLERLNDFISGAMSRRACAYDNYENLTEDLAHVVYADFVAGSNISLGTIPVSLYEEVLTYQPKRDETLTLDEERVKVAILYADREAVEQGLNQGVVIQCDTFGTLEGPETHKTGIWDDCIWTQYGVGSEEEFMGWLEAEVTGRALSNTQAKALDQATLGVVGSWSPSQADADALVPQENGKQQVQQQHQQRSRRL